MITKTLVHLLKISCFLALILVLSCKKHKDTSADQITQIHETAVALQIDTLKMKTCKISEVEIKIVIQEIRDDLNKTDIVLHTNTQVLKTSIDINNLDFLIQEFTNLDIVCSDYGFYVEYQEKNGNNYSITNHVFQLDDNSEAFFWTKVYKIESTRQGISISGFYNDIDKNFKNYDGNEGEAAFIPIFSFTGFQENKEPNLINYLNQIKNASNKKNLKKLELFCDPIIIDHLMKITKIHKDNISNYNDIAYYLEQAGAYKEAISLLEKIIIKFPERTVAYINLGDAYWELQNIKNAKEAYQKYFEQMESEDKLDKIPNRIIERLQKF